MENYAAVLHGPNDVRVEKWPMPKINDSEVLIRMSCVGICGSDVKLYSTGQCGFDVITEPLVIGHEGAGIVTQVGTNVTSLKVGDRVAIEPTQPCRGCEFCRQGRYNLCRKPGYCSSMGVSGNLAQYYKHVADFCHKIPDNLSIEEGAAVQPLAIAIHACNRANIRLGDTVLVMGAGPIGVLCAMSARAMGAARIMMTDVVESRLETVKSRAAAEHILLVSQLTEEETGRQIENALDGRPDVTIDACGFPSAQRVAMTVTRTGGLILVVGISPEKVEVPLSNALLREVDIRGSYRIVNTYPAALQAVSKGAIDLKSFITHRYPMEKTKEAIELAKSGEAMKIIINIQQ